MTHELLVPLYLCIYECICLISTVESYGEWIQVADLRFKHNDLFHAGLLVHFACGFISQSSGFVVFHILADLADEF
jgi:hypothetical protein